MGLSRDGASLPPLVGSRARRGRLGRRDAASNGSFRYALCCTRIQIFGIQIFGTDRAVLWRNLSKKDEKYLSTLDSTAHWEVGGTGGFLDVLRGDEEAADGEGQREPTEPLRLALVFESG